MYKHSRTIAAALGMLVLILDAQSALAGARDGLSLCLETVIPTLFPFSVLATYLCSHAAESGSFLRPLGKLCRIPSGLENILLLGFLGGYPVGIQCICQAYQSGSVEKRDAERMVGFCSNAGIAFVFGMAGGLFPSNWYSLGVLLTTVVSAVVTGFLLPGHTENSGKAAQTAPLSLQKCTEKAILSMARICAWVILFRILLSFSERWFLFLFPKEAQSLFSGVLELTSGILSLKPFPTGIKFMLASTYLSFGGICVLMQSHALTDAVGLNSRLYLPGKILQSLLSFLLSYLIQTAFQDGRVAFNGFLFLILCMTVILFIWILKKYVEKTPAMLYNTERNGGNARAFSEEDPEAVPVLCSMRETG